MNDRQSLPFDEEKISRLDAYLDLIGARVLKRLELEAVRKSCSATLLLLFAAVDALGGLIHEEDDAGNKERSRAFFRFIDAKYAERFELLWALRNALVHNAINVESYLSSTELEGWAHLDWIGRSRRIYVHTGLASRDLLDAFRRVRSKFEEDPAAALRAADRLDWEETAQEPPDQGPLPTPPPPVRFVREVKPRRSTRRR